MENKQNSFYQYHADLDFPIFVQVVDGLEGKDEGNLASLLKQMKFRELSGHEIDSVDKTLSENPQARMLTLKVASFKLANQINTVASSDRYGHESVVPKTGYKVYRYKGMALMVYSFAAPAWECGVTANFCVGENGIMAARGILNRYLTWSMSALGVIGFWAVPVDEGFVVLNQKESMGEVVFVDVLNQKMMSMDGVRDISGGLEILRLDSGLRDRSQTMRSTELLSFLSVKTSYLDPEGVSTPVRQMLNQLSKMALGKVYPRSSFQPRTDMDLVA